MLLCGTYNTNFTMPSELTWIQGSGLGDKKQGGHATIGQMGGGRWEAGGLTYF